MAGHESCPRCAVGVLYVITDTEDSSGHLCHSCGYHESRVKPGYSVKHPGAPIVKDEPAAKSGKGT